MVTAVPARAEHGAMSVEACLTSANGLGAAQHDAEATAVALRDVAGSTQAEDVLPPKVMQ